MTLASPVPARSLAELQALEDAAFAAWPAQLSIDVGGWQVRLDRGYTKRANSANATARSRELSATDIEAIEARFRQHGLTPTFRLPSFAAVGATDALLAQRGYRWCDESLVMARALSDAADGAGVTLVDDAASWLATFQAVSGKSGADQVAHLEMLQRIAHPCAWAADGPPGSPRCCGLGVLVDGQLGLFDIATHVDHQRQGLAERLCNGLVAWGRAHGARSAFLQVVASKAPAVRLYERMGFRVAYRYGYRVQEMTALSTG